MVDEWVTAIADRSSDAEVIASAINQLNSLIGRAAEEVEKYRRRILAIPGSVAPPTVLRALSKLARASKLLVTARAIDEARLQQAPDDTDLRFEVAYQYGEDNHTELSFLHYHSIPATMRNPVTWNNLVVAYGN